MGKRKSARKPGAGKVKQAPLAKTFKCLFCQHVNTVLCRMDRPNRIGRLDCKDCLQSFQAAITSLDEPIDLYSQWIDACEEVNTPAAATTSTSSRAPTKTSAPTRGRVDDEDDDSDADLPDLPGTRKSKGRSPEEEEEEEEEEEDAAADEDDDDDDDDEDTNSRAAPPPKKTNSAASGDMGYEVKGNAKMQALLEQKRARVAVDSDDD